ncbi:MAG: class I SAM-dependent methyltransferase [Deltaproteobacteria bacterium]|nr:class I SAM-dependent methyltransferase [Deltaproteobacteria bacterium]
MIYANPAPSDSQLLTLYTRAGFVSARESIFAGQTYSKYLPAIVSRLPDLKGALDVGTGDGAFLEHLVRYGFSSITGIEPSADSISKAKPAIRPLIKKGFFNPNDHGDEQYSLVSLFQTVEHLLCPMETTRAFFRILKKGGALFIAGHNFKALSSRLMRTRSPIFDVEHMQLFSKKSLFKMMKEAGFSDIKVDPMMNTYPLNYYAQLVPLPQRIKAPLMAVLTKTGLSKIAIPAYIGNLAAIGYKR